MKRTEKGFTLVEVMLALSILAFGLLSVAAMQLNAIRGSAFAAGLSEATEGTQQAIELQLSIPYASMANGNDTITGPRGTVLTRTWTVANPTPDYATITATTTYVDEMAKNRTISLTTVRARN
ncbi:MAG: prepilin-type N-terminal cleavage/methylation domain-containing protein [Myxococcota bacterium]